MTAPHTPYRPDVITADESVLTPEARTLLARFAPNPDEPQLDVTVLGWYWDGDSFVVCVDSEHGPYDVAHVPAYEQCLATMRRRLAQMEREGRFAQAPAAESEAAA